MFNLWKLFKSSNLNKLSCNFNLGEVKFHKTYLFGRKYTNLKPLLAFSIVTRSHLNSQSAQENQTTQGSYLG